MGAAAGAKELIYAKLKPLALRMDADDYLELPEINDVVQRLTYPPTPERYMTLEDDLVAKIEERTVTAANAATAGGKLWQVCNGGLYVDNDVASIIGGKKRTTLKLHDVKTDWLEDLIDELTGTTLLIAYQFEHDLDRFLSASEMTYVHRQAQPRQGDRACVEPQRAGLRSGAAGRHRPRS
jgi:hypothetical protein